MRPEDIEKVKKADAKQALRLQMDYRNTFGSQGGHRVLMDLLIELGYFAPIDNEEQRIRHNVAKEIVMKICGQAAINLPTMTVSGILSLVNTGTEEKE